MYLENLSCVAEENSLPAAVLIYKVICYPLIMIKKTKGVIFSL